MAKDKFNEATVVASSRSRAGNKTLLKPKEDSAGTGGEEEKKIKEIFNSDAKKFGGSGQINSRQILIKKQPWNNREYSAEMTVPPLGVSIFKFK